MKPAVFDYRRAASLDEAVALLSEYGTDAKVLAGGQSLLPMMKLRLARPGVVVDLGRAVGLDYVRADGGALAFGAMARLVELSLPRSASAARSSWPRRATSGIRLSGIEEPSAAASLTPIPPPSCLPLPWPSTPSLSPWAPGARRVIPAERFFVTYLTTDLAPDEILAEVRFPLGGETVGWGFQELSRRFGDYAMAAAATVLITAPDGTIAKARIALAGVADRAVRAREAEALLVGAPGEAGRFAEAARIAAEALTPPADVHGSSAYRRHLAGVLVERALADAWGRARAPGH